MVCHRRAGGSSVVSFKELKLNSKLLRAVEAGGFVAPTDIQRQAIPVVLAGRDLMASAQTGTGKTAAFLLADARVPRFYYRFRQERSFENLWNIH